MKTLLLCGLALLSLACARADAGAAQLAPYYAPAVSYACDGSQHDSGFALDYGQAVYIRHVEIVLIGAANGQTGTVTLSIAVAPGQPAPYITGLGGAETSAHVDYGVNGILVPTGQALALEWSCAGGGARTLLMTISYTANAGPTP